MYSASVCDAIVWLVDLGIQHGEITDCGDALYELYSVDCDGSFDFESIRDWLNEDDIADMAYTPIETKSGKKVFHKVRLSLSGKIWKKNHRKHPNSPNVEF